MADSGPALYKLPRQMGWVAGAVALVGSFCVDFLRHPEDDPLEMICRACIWAGLAAVLAAVLGFLLFLALGGNPQKEPSSEGEELDVAPSLLEGPGRLVDLTAGSVDDGLEPVGSPSELDGFSAEEMARAVQSQLRAEDS